ncbi:hypothetical protein EPN83_01970 [Patescibacteria group bacterium]|nr:MAG: hypothetical protein EPN83_01970 [Patescibacteria group bacterium]
MPFITLFERFVSLFSDNKLLREALSAAWNLLPLWLPILLVTLFLQIWFRYKRTEWIKKQGSVLLEIRLPKEIEKPPSAMEVVLNALSQPSVGNYLDVYLKGRVRPWFALELVSLEGQVKFFVWTFATLKNIVEAQIYSQYPTVEVHEVPDYALRVKYDPENFSIWGAQLKLTKADVYPLKTYVDYGLDKTMAEEEEKVDPITAVLEFLGSMRPGEQAWVQILIRAHRSEGLKDRRIFKKADWKDAAKTEIKRIIEKETFVKTEKEKPPALLGLTDNQKFVIGAIERSISKPAFDTMIRCVYLARKDVYNSFNISGLTGVFKQFSSQTLNGLAVKWKTKFEYPWEDFRGIRRVKNEMKMLDAYKRRSYFQPPYRFFHGKPFILTSEEVATLYHFPGGVATTPTFARIASRKAEPPANLPI